MKLYRLRIAPDGTDGEGEDHDEWFSSLEAAKSRRRNLIRDNPGLLDHRYGRDFMIEEIVLLKLPPRQLALAILNRRNYVARRNTVVPDYVPGPELRKRLIREAAEQELED